MPELPEVEITRRSLLTHVTGQKIEAAVIHNRRLRWPIPKTLNRTLQGKTVTGISRRAKYLLFDCGVGTLIMHLGMSGSLRVLPRAVPLQEHEHFELLLASGQAVRLRDPRRFGAVLWQIGDPLLHPLLVDLGPEPLSDTFDANWLYQQTRTRSASIKQALMDSRLVSGVGNIYANECLFRAGIHPQIPANQLSLRRYQKLVPALRETLHLALEAGGSSLRDFVDSAGNPGYFQQRYFVYGRTGEKCHKCGSMIRWLQQGQRSSFFCARCQR